MAKKRSEYSEYPRPVYNLQDTLRMAWERVEEGARKSRSPFHLFVLSTVDTEGRPQSRTVVLREASADGLWLRFNTDRRSSKFSEALANPSGSVVLYDPELKLQVRMAVRLQAIEGKALDDIWEATPSHSRKCYQVVGAPGNRLEVPEALEWDTASKDEGRSNFASFRAQVESLEVLALFASRHRRAQARYGAEGVCAQWVVP